MRDANKCYIQIVTSNQLNTDHSIKQESMMRLIITKYLKMDITIPSSTIVRSLK